MIAFARAAAVAGALSLTSAATAQAYEPDGPIEFVIMTGHHDGADDLAHAVADIAAEMGLFPYPITFSYHSVGGGAEAFQYLLSAEDPNRVLLVTRNSFFTIPQLQAGLGVDVMDFAPIALMGEDHFVLWVRASDGPEDFAGFVAAAQAKGGEWIMVGAGFGSPEEILTGATSFIAGAPMSYRGRDSGGHAIESLIRGDADSAIETVADAIAYFENGRVKPVLVFSDARLPTLPDTPTFSELGYGFSYHSYRQIVGGPAMSEAATAYYAERFAQIYESDAWREVMLHDALEGDFLTGGPLREVWAAEMTHHEGLLRAIDALP